MYAVAFLQCRQYGRMWNPKRHGVGQHIGPGPNAGRTFLLPRGGFARSFLPLSDSLMFAPLILKQSVFYCTLYSPHLALDCGSNAMYVLVRHITNVAVLRFRPSL